MLFLILALVFYNSKLWEQGQWEKTNNWFYTKKTK